MKFFAVSCLATVAAVTGVQANTAPQIGSIFGRPNTEFGIATRGLFATFPGVAEKASDISMQIYQFERSDVNKTTLPGGTLVHTYNVPQEESTVNWGFRFHIDSLQKDKLYGAKICQGANNCSPVTRPLSWVNDGSEQLTCKDVASPPAPIAPPKFKSIDDSTVQLTMKMIDSKPTYYLKVTGQLNLASWKEFFENNDPNMGGKYCSKKYLASVVLQVVEKTSKRSKAAFKFGINPLSDSAVKTYITGASAATSDITLYMRFHLGKINLSEAKHYGSSTHDLVFSLCFTDKDVSGLYAVVCSEAKVVSGVTIAPPSV